MSHETGAPVETKKEEKTNALEETIGELLPLDALPAANELQDMWSEHPGAAYILQNATTVDSLKHHFTGALPGTPEIGISVLPDGREVLKIGSKISVDNPPEEVKKQRIIDFHTHPDPNTSQINQYPSIADIRGAQMINEGGAYLIGTATGIINVPKLPPGQGGRLTPYTDEARSFISNIELQDPIWPDRPDDERIWRYFLHVAKPTFLS